MQCGYTCCVDEEADGECAWAVVIRAGEVEVVTGCIRSKRRCEANLIALDVSPGAARKEFRFTSVNFTGWRGLTGLEFDGSGVLPGVKHADAVALRGRADEDLVA